MDASFWLQKKSASESDFSLAPLQRMENIATKSYLDLVGSRTTDSFIRHYATADGSFLCNTAGEFEPSISSRTESCT